MDGRPAAGGRRSLLLSVFAIFVLGWAAYLPALENGLVNWDDGEYVQQNPYTYEVSLDNTRAVFGGFFKGNYHPLTLISLALDRQLGADDPRVLHATSVLLHLLSSLLVFSLVGALFGRRDLAFVVGLLFALHPLHVESVAWVSARKDVLFAFFGLASLRVYVAFTRAHDRAGGGAARLYGAALLLFVCALLSKAMAVALAPSLLLLDHALGRAWRSPARLLEKLPFFALALGFGALAIAAQRASGQLVGESEWSVIERLALGCSGYVAYLSKLLAPQALSAFYPYPERVAGALPVAYYGYVIVMGGVLGLGLGFGLANRHRMTSEPERSGPLALAFFGLAFFSINIALVLQFIPVGGAVMADRYPYLASLGFFMLVGAASVWAFDRSDAWRRAAVLALAVYCLWLGASTHQRSLVWRDSLSLWSDVLAQFPDVPVARVNRALAYFEAGDLAAADRDLSAALTASPRYALALAHRGVVRHRRGDTGAALADLDRALVIAPSADVYSNRGGIRLEAGNVRGAIVDLDRAIALDPRHVLAFANRGLAHSAAEEHLKALMDFRVAANLSPGYTAAHYGSGAARLALGEPSGAAMDFSSALRIDPELGPAYLGRGRALLILQQHDRACSDFKEAQRFGEQGASGLFAQHCQH